MGIFDKKEENYYSSRNHQDNCKWSEIDHTEHDNGSYQYCRFCNAHRPFKWNRCMTCHNN